MSFCWVSKDGKVIVIDYPAENPRETIEIRIENDYLMINLYNYFGYLVYQYELDLENNRDVLIDCLLRMRCGDDEIESFLNRVEWRLKDCAKIVEG